MKQIICKFCISNVVCFIEIYLFGKITTLFIQKCTVKKQNKKTKTDFVLQSKFMVFI